MFAENYVLIGDSHTVGFMGQDLVKKINAKSTENTITRYAVSGSSAKDWASNSFCIDEKSCPFKMGFILANQPSENKAVLPLTFPTTEQLLKNSPAQTYIFALGTNDIAQNCSSEKMQLSYIKKIIEKTLQHNKKCIWVGPPQYTSGRIKSICGSEKKYSEFVDQIKSITEKNCDFIDSRNFSNLLSYVSADTIHFSKAGGEYWAENVFQEIQSIQKNKKGPGRPEPFNLSATKNVTPGNQ